MPRTDFECVICGDGKFEALPRWVDDDSRICDECAVECVAPHFHNALEHEHHYPPMFGKVVMDIWTFWDLFDGDFLTAWSKKTQEYNVPVKSRVYCEQRGGVDGDVCGAYLGTRGPGSVCCSECHCSTCRKCGAGSGDVSSAKTHRCQEVSKEDPFEKLSKGRDYQQCPSCKKEIFQAEGCNHMVCLPPCATHFCFVCGEQVTARRSGHWQQGRCPRFGVQGKNLIWDNDGEHSETDLGENDFEENDFEENESDPDFEPDPERGTDDEFEIDDDLDSAEQYEVQDLIERFDQAAEAELLEDTRARLTIIPSVRRESRANFFGYISQNLAIVDQVRRPGPRFSPDDATNVLEEFRTRDRRIMRQLRLYHSVMQPEAGPTDLADLRDELNAYSWYVIQTTARLTHIAQTEDERVASDNLDQV
jgi:hypothetical protein